MAAVPPELRILLIEDDDDHALLIDKQLRRVDSQRIKLTREDRLSAGLGQLSTNQFDAVLLDLNLPDSTGAETCYKVCEAAGAVPVIVLTSLAVSSDAVALVRDTAEDYLPKSNLDGELIARAILCGVERAGRRQAEAELQHAEGELDAARKIQTELLPTNPPTIPGFEIAAACWPAEFVAGDYYDFLPGQGGTLGIAVGDAVGHGPRAAMLMSVAAGCVRSAFDAGGDLKAVISRINNVLEHHPPTILLMTLLLIRLDPQTRSLVYSSAGHPHGYLFDEQGELQQSFAEYNGVSLGVVPGCEYRQSEPIGVPPGHLLVLVSDGVLEAHPGNFDRFETARLFDVIANHHDESVEAILQAIHRAVTDHLAGQAVEDDITVVAVRSVH